MPDSRAVATGSWSRRVVWKLFSSPITQALLIFFALSATLSESLPSNPPLAQLNLLVLLNTMIVGTAVQSIGRAARTRNAAPRDPGHAIFEACFFGVGVLALNCWRLYGMRVLGGDDATLCAGITVMMMSLFILVHVAVARWRVAVLRASQPGIELELATRANA